MKILKTFLIIVVVLVVVFAVLAAIAPHEFQAQRSIVIDAPVPVVMSQVNTFENMNKWSPWAEKDPDMKTTIEGTDGEVGTIYKWEGNSAVGKGSQELTLIADNRVETELKFGEMQTASTGYLQAKEVERGTEVTWGIKGYMPFPWNIMMLFGDGGVGKDFEKGLAKLKDRVESMEMPEEATSTGYDVNEVLWEGKTFIAKRAQVPFDSISYFFHGNMPALYQALETAGVQMQGAPCGIYYSWDEENGVTDMAVAVPVSEDVPGVEGFEKIVIDSSKALQIAYYGDFSGFDSAYNAMEAYLHKNDIEPENVAIEEYVTDPMQEPDTSRWLTNIYYLIR